MNWSSLYRSFMLATVMGTTCAYFAREWALEQIAEETDPWLAYEQMPVQQGGDGSGDMQPNDKPEPRGMFNLLDSRRERGRYPGDEGKNQTKVKASFKPVSTLANSGTATIYCDDKEAALAAVVDAKGQLLTKASELHGRITVGVNGKKYSARVLGVSREPDLALLSIAAEGLKPIQWRDSGDPVLGSFLVTVSPAAEPVAIGVLSVKARKISSPSGLLGIMLEQANDGPQILRVLEGSAAEAAGLKANDVVLQVNDTRVTTRESLIEYISNFRPGDKLQLRIRRGSETLAIGAILGRPETGRPTNGSGKNRRTEDERLAGELSERRGGFPTVLQHDTVLRPQQIGGPLIDLDGRAVGLNIARADRVSTYALPAATVQTVLKDLQAGKLPAPPELRGDDRDRLTYRLKSLEEAVTSAEKAKKAADEALAKAKKSQADAEQAAKDAAKASGGEFKPNVAAANFAPQVTAVKLATEELTKAQAELKATQDQLSKLGK